MIRDIIVNLEHLTVRDPARDFAISMAETFDAHVAGIAFAYAPELPGYAIPEIPPDIVAQMVAESERAASAAIERFDAAAISDHEAQVAGQAPLAAILCYQFL